MIQGMLIQEDEKTGKKKKIRCEHYEDIDEAIDLIGEDKVLCILNQNINSRALRKAGRSKRILPTGSKST